MIETEERELDLVFDVNVFGPYRITRAFGPLMVESKGRVANIGSISGIAVVEGCCCVQHEQARGRGVRRCACGGTRAFDMEVSVIEPGNYRSEIGNSAAKRAGNTNRMADRTKYKEPDEVADAVLHALSDPQPRRRYMVVPNQTEAEWTIKKQIEELVQLNGKQPYSYDRKALVEMLDAALAAARQAPMP